MHQHVCQHNSLSLFAHASMVISPISTNMPVVTPKDGKDGKSTTTYHAETRRWRHTMVVSQANQSRQNCGRRIFSCSPSPPRCHHPRGHHTNHLPERSKSETLLNLCPRVYVKVRFCVSSLCCLFLPAPGSVLVPMQMLVADPCGIAMPMAITVELCEVCAAR